MSQFEQLKNSNKELSDFPRHSLEALKNKITFGSYQMNFCFSNLLEHFKEHNSFKIAVYKYNHLDSKIITKKIKSRHSSSRQY